MGSAHFTLFGSFALQPLTYLYTASGGSEAAASGLAEGDIHEVADFLHGVDDLVGRDHALDSGECHVSGRHRVDGADDVALHARYLDETGYRAKEYNGLHGMYKKSRSEGFGEEVKRRIMLGSFVLSSGYYDAYYLKALRTKALIKQSFDRAFEKYDVILGPVAPTTTPKLGESLSDPIKMYLGDIYTISVNLAGLPGISVPCGVDSKGLPIGMQLIGDCFKEDNIIRAAYAFEQTRTYERCAAAKAQD